MWPTWTIATLGVIAALLVLQFAWYAWTHRRVPYAVAPPPPPPPPPPPLAATQAPGPSRVPSYAYFRSRYSIRLGPPVLSADGWIPLNVAQISRPAVLRSLDAAIYAIAAKQQSVGVPLVGRLVVTQVRARIDGAAYAYEVTARGGDALGRALTFVAQMRAGLDGSIALTAPVRTYGTVTA